MAANDSSPGHDPVDHWFHRHTGRRLTVTRLEPNDLFDIDEPDDMTKSQHLLTPELAEEIASGPYAFSFWNQQGILVACAGVRVSAPGRAEAWAIFSTHVKRDMVSVWRAIRDFIRVVDLRRIEATSPVGFPQGHAFLHACGFQPEGIMKSLYQRGVDHILYSVVKDID